jgi:hypothetical protein
MGFVLSEKSVLVCGNKQLARQLQRFFLKFGINLSIGAHATHLGHCRAGHGRHTFKVLGERFKKASARTRRVALLAKHDTRSKRLFKTGVKPMATYGASVYGLSRAQLRKIDDLAVKCAGPRGALPDSRAVLWEAYEAFPSVDIRCDHVGKWGTLWIRLASSEATAVEGAWEKWRSKLAILDHDKRYRLIECPISSVVTILRNAGWAPSKPNVWFDPSDAIHSFSDV